MATTYQSDYAKGLKAMPSPIGSEVVSIRMKYTIAAALVINDVLEMGYLPENCVPVDMLLDSDDLDTNGTPLVTLTAGTLNAGATAIATAWLTASTIGQAGGSAGPDSAGAKAMVRVTASDTARTKIGVLVAAAPATSATTGEVGLTLSYRAAAHGN